MALPHLLPGIACALSGIALLFCLVLLLLLRRTERASLKEQPSDPALVARLGELTTEVGQLRSRVEEVEQRKGSLVDWAAEPSSLNLNRRGQVLRLYRRGDSVDQIASTLGLSAGEVALIVKVQEMGSVGRNGGNV